MCVCSVAQLCTTLCDPVDYSLPGSSFHGVFQARILEWVAISYSRESSWPRDWTQVFCISSLAGRFFTTAPPGKPTCIYTIYNIQYCTNRGKFFCNAITCIHGYALRKKSLIISIIMNRARIFLINIIVDCILALENLLTIFKSENTSGSSFRASLIVQLVKNLPAMQETPGWFLDREDPLEKG